MWFKQVTFFKLTQTLVSDVANFSQRLAPQIFKPCLPSMASSSGWIAPLDEEPLTSEGVIEEPSLALGANQCLLFCLQTEEKILPASVVNHELKLKIKQIESQEMRKLGQKEKLNLKDEIIFTLLQRAFSKYTLLYAYVDTVNQWLVINSTNPAKVEQFVGVFKKSMGDCVSAYEINKPAARLTHWLKEKQYPDSFNIERSCVLKDPNQQNRMIRAQQQNLFADSIQSLLKDGCEVSEIALTWQDKLNFIVNENFAIKSCQLAADDLLDEQDLLETKRQRLTADLVIMSTLYAEFFNDLIDVFANTQQLAEAV